MPQTIQGADRLAASLDAIVLIPDFFQGGAMNVDFVPADTDEKKASVDKFRKEKMNFPETLDQLIRTTTEAKQKWPSVEAWAVFGLCWGGKIATLASGEGTLFKCSGQAHPGYVRSLRFLALLMHRQSYDKRGCREDGYPTYLLGFT